MTTPTDALPEPVERVLGYAGKVRNQVMNPCITAQETIVIADWFTAARAARAEAHAAELADAREQLSAHDAIRAQLEAERDACKADAERWQSLYRRAINEANGLTNYVEDRPELRSAEKRLSAIEAEARTGSKP